jgi:hypothetical protein
MRKTMLTDKNLLSIHEHNFDSPDYLKHKGFYGTQRLYRYKNNYGLSLVNTPILHTFPFAWEAAVIRFDNDESNVFQIIYDTELTDNVEVFFTDDKANAFIERAEQLFNQ